ncbi:ArsR/SmtB family transcription factor [Corynebacterium callunae]|uniref:ArsR/SmtB family transcription factor n=1 Tax=Corynebacterium callunae TaxID=1721 RepID=UPI0039827A70
MIPNSTRNFFRSANEGLGSRTIGEMATAPSSHFDSKEVSMLGNVLRALDSPVRIEIVLALNERPHYVHELVKRLNSSQPLISQHLKVLKSAHVVDAERKGRQMTYFLAEPLVIDIFGLALKAAKAEQV